MQRNHKIGISRAAFPALLGLLLTSGCANFDLDATDLGRAPRLLRSTALELEADGEPWTSLKVDPAGNIVLGDYILPNIVQLPRVSEERRFGVSFVDLDALPSSWRPAYALEGRVMVAGLTESSPLAIAGLRIFDVIDRLDGELVSTPADLVTRLEHSDVGSEIELTVARADGSRGVVAPVVDGYRDSTTFTFPFLFEYENSDMAYRLGVPGFEWEEVVKFDYDDDDSPRYVRESGWKLPLSLVRYRRHEDLATGRDGRKLTFLWFISFDMSREEGTES